ncbi:MAG: IS66 family transposase, partial [Cyclonatronaceae bacterium]
LEKNYKVQFKLFEEKIAWLNSQLFARTSEKLTPEDIQQSLLFDESEQMMIDKDTVPAETKEVKISSYTRKKGTRKKLPDWLPRIDVIHDLAAEDKLLPDGRELKKIGEVVSEKLDIIPPKFQVIRNIRYKYAVPENTAEISNDDNEEEQPGIVVAALPPQLLEKSIATPGLAAFSIVSKFCDALPFYRQSKIFARVDIDLPRATLCRWPIMIHGKYRDFFLLMREEIQRYPVIGIDETRVQVLDEPGRKNTDTSYMWVFRGHGAEKPTILFEYNPSKSAHVALEHLKDYEGCIQTDGYSSYDSLLRGKNASHAGCWAHARRKFYDAAKNASNDSNASAAISFIAKLYAVENEAREKKLSIEEIKKIRNEKSRPVINGFREWIDNKVDHIPPKSLLGKAIRYTLNEWEKLLLYLDDGTIPIDNNLVENTIRPFVVGRKNWLFSGSPDGAHASAAFYSIIETAKACGHEPYWYLRHLFECLPYAKNRDELRALLPQYLDPNEIPRKTNL